MLVVGPEIPEAMRPFALSVVEAIRALQTPLSPTPLFPCLEAGLPPAADWTNFAVWVSDLSVAAVSDGTDWIRLDTGAAI
jgi:hypothetical protein